MALVRYQADDLIKLRESPLVRRPDGLPDIQLWMESVFARQRGETEVLTLAGYPQNKLVPSVAKHKQEE